MITVFGLLGAPGTDLIQAAADATYVVAPDRVLDALDVAPQRRIRLGALRPAVAQLAGLPPEVPVVVVASGDPLFFGVVRSLHQHGLQPRVVTGASSIASAFARVGVPWDDAVVVSAHGRPIATAINLARAHPKVAVFTAPDSGLAELAAALEDQQRWYVLAERLGETDEKIQILTTEQARAAETSHPNVVLILADHPDAPGPGWGATIAGPDRAPRPRPSAAAAVAFAALLPEPGELLWATGDLAADVAALAAWSGAAVDRDPAIPRPEAAALPEVVLAGDPAALQGISPRAVVLDTGGPLPGGYRWTEHVLAERTIWAGERA
ncbi:MAG: precorrin-6y C5,15-methyltransferase (decarboxylating) subunit CbiE [Arachnia sp.]